MRLLPLFPVIVLSAQASIGATPADPQDTQKAAAGLETSAYALVAEISPKVEEIRGLKFKRPVAVKVVDAASAREHFKARVLKLYSTDMIRHDQSVYLHLGLVPQGTDILSTTLDMIQEQAGGYYDPSSDVFFLVDNLPVEIAPLVIVHELTHALDDQHYGIDTLLEKVKKEDDRSTALVSVIEGSGMLVMTAYMIREIQARRMEPTVMEALAQTEARRAEKLQAAPPVLQRGLVAPYMLGLSFLLRGDPFGIARGLKPQDIDRAFKDPPLSTEQILRPEKYWDQTKRDEPLVVPLPDMSSSLGEGWSLVRQGTLGEITVAVLSGARSLDLKSPEIARAASWTNQAASGLTGDVYHYYQNGVKGVTLLATVWDTPDDATEFQRALRAELARSSVRVGNTLLIAAGDTGGGATALATTALNGLSSALAAERRR